MPVRDDKSNRVRLEQLRRRAVTAFDAVIVLVAVAVIFLFAAAAMAPRFKASIATDQMSAEGGHAFTFGPGFEARWPYAIPSHPDFALAPDDIKVTENGEFFGMLEPAHDTIRQLGDGRFNSWQGTIWFSSSDNTDPRTNGRAYGVRVKARLAPSALVARTWSVATLAVLILCRVGTLIWMYVARAIAHLGERWALASQSRAGLAALSRWSDLWVAPAARLARRVPLTFGRTFAILSSAVLAVFCWQSLTRPMPLLFGTDSFSYVQPGILWAAGRDVAGESSRDLGYPALTVLALRLGSLSTIPLLQLFIVIAGLACVLGVLYLMIAGAASRLNGVSRIPMWILTPCACAVAAAYGMLVLNHDLFVIDIYSAMAEAPHFLPTALTLLFFVGGWTANTAVRRVAFLMMALVFAYLSVMVKPHTLMVLALCAASLLSVSLTDFRAFRSPLILFLGAVSAGLIVEVHGLDTRVTPPHGDFGPKTLFCNHLDVVEPVFDTSTPERARIMELLRGVLENPDRWPLMGYKGDHCVYDMAFTDSINAAAKADGLSAAAWEEREFARAILKNPVAYGRDVAKQLVYFMVHPIDDVDREVRSDIADDDWKRFAPFQNLIHMPRAQFKVDVSNWVPAAYPVSASLAKYLLRNIATIFAAVTLGSTILALSVMLFLRGRVDLRPEITMVATAAFTTAFVMTTALAHTFDVGRYLTDILPFSLLWLVIGAAYIAHGLVLLSTVVLRQSHRPSETGSVPLCTAGARERAASAVRPGSAHRAPQESRHSTG